MEAEERVEVLTRLLSDASAKVRLHALRGISVFRIPSSTMARILAMLSDPSREVRQEAGWVIAGILEEGEAVDIPAPVFANLFGSEDPDKRRAACRLAAQRRSPAHVKMLASLAGRDPVAEVRETAGSALAAHLPSREAAEAIFQVIAGSPSSGEEGQRLLANLALHVGDHASDAWVRRRIYEILSQCAAPKQLHALWVRALAPHVSKDPYIRDLLVRLVANSSESWGLREDAARALLPLAADPAVWPTLYAYALVGQGVRHDSIVGPVSAELCKVAHADLRRHLLEDVRRMGCVRAAELLFKAARFKAVQNVFVHQLRNPATSQAQALPIARALASAGQIGAVVDSGILSRCAALLNDPIVLDAAAEVPSAALEWVVRWALLNPSTALLRKAGVFLTSVPTEVADQLMRVCGECVDWDREAAVLRLLRKMTPQARLRDPYRTFILGRLRRQEPDDVQLAALDAIGDLAGDAGIRDEMADALGRSFVSPTVKDHVIRVLAGKDGHDQDPDSPAHGDERPRRRAGARSPGDPSPRRPAVRDRASRRPRSGGRRQARP